MRIAIGLRMVVLPSMATQNAALSHVAPPRLQKPRTELFASLTSLRRSCMKPLDVTVRYDHGWSTAVATVSKRFDGFEILNPQEGYLRSEWKVTRSYQ